MNRHPMSHTPYAVRLPAGMPPQLLVFIDTEEEFDWGRSFSSDARGVTAMKHQWRAQTIFDRYGVKPVYLVDYPVASQPAGYSPLREFLADGRCDIGAHLHPWVTPPAEEDVTDEHSFACNLPRDLEHRKLAILKETIERNLGVAPTIYRAPLAATSRRRPSNAACSRSSNASLHRTPSPSVLPRTISSGICCRPLMVYAW
jgi:hypothetical protein